jgi:hypothetical protein
MPLDMSLGRALDVARASLFRRLPANPADFVTLD